MEGTQSQGGQSGPRSFGRLMDAAFGIYTKRFVPLAKIAAIIFIPLTAVIFAIDLWAYAPIGRAEADFDDLLRLDNKIVDSGRILTGTVLQVVISVIGLLLVVGASLRGASEIYLGREPEVGRSLRFAARRAGSMLWIILLMMLAIFGLGIVAALLGVIGILLFLLLGVFLLVRWWLAMPSLLFEDKRGVSAMRRSSELVADHWWRVFGVLLVIGIFVTIVGSLLPELIINGFQGIGEDNFNLWLLLYDVLNSLGTILTAPILAAATVVLYYDLRVRKEGFDLELLVDELDDPGSSSAKAPGQATEPPATPPSSIPPPSASPPPDPPA